MLSPSKKMPVLMDGTSNIHQGNAESFGFCNLAKIFSDTIAMILLQSHRRSHVSEL